MTTATETKKVDLEALKDRQPTQDELDSIGLEALNEDATNTKSDEDKEIERIAAEQAAEADKADKSDKGKNVKKEESKKEDEEEGGEVEANPRTHRRAGSRFFTLAGEFFIRPEPEHQNIGAIAAPRARPERPDGFDRANPHAGPVWRQSDDLGLDFMCLCGVPTAPLTQIRPSRNAITLAHKKGNDPFEKGWA
jgi:hypothetical protein